MIAIVNYGCGNLYSLSSSLKLLGIEAKITGEPDEIRSAEKIILPGVGAFGDAVKKLRDTGLFDVIKECSARGVKILGICLGMQLLFEKSLEYGEHEGLGFIKGSVCPLESDIDKNLKIPHMGWNKLDIKTPEDPFFKYIKNGDYMYFVHSFYGKNCDESVIASAEYDAAVPAVVKNGNVYGAQFHPEKSGSKGLALLKAFAQL